MTYNLNFKTHKAMMIQLTVTQKNKTTLASVAQLFDTINMSDIQAEGTGTSFYAYGSKYSVSESLATVKASMAVSVVAASQLQKEIWGVFDCAVVANRTIGTHNLLDPVTGIAIQLPIGAVITQAFYIVDTTFASATNAATLAVGCAVDAVAGLKAAIAISNGANPWTVASPVHAAAMIPVETAATMITPLTAARTVDVAVAVEALTAGKMRVCIRYAVAP